MEIVDTLKAKQLYPFVVSARSENRSRDGEGVDFVNKNEHKHGRMEDDIQGKNSCSNVPYPKLLGRIRDQPFPVIFHKQTEKVGERFIVRDKFAITYLNSYLKLLQYRKAYRLLKQNLDHLPGDKQVEIIEQLSKLDIWNDPL